MPDEAALKKIMKWSLEQQDDTKPSEEKKSLDPELLKYLFGGKSEAQQMQEALQVIEDAKTSPQNLETALDNFEMLIEDLDNANNIQNMQMWPRLIVLLSSKNPVIRRNIAWIIGTAVQNNEKSQKNFLDNDGLKALIKAINKEEDSKVKEKILFALSSEIRNNTDAVAYLNRTTNMSKSEDEISQNGWKAISNGLRHANESVVAKSANILYQTLQYGQLVELNNLLSVIDPEFLLAAAKRALISGDRNTTEPILRLYLEVSKLDKGKFSESQNRELSQLVTQYKTKNDDFDDH